MDIVFRAIALYVFVVFVMRVIGRRELSSTTSSGGSSRRTARSASSRRISRLTLLLSETDVRQLLSPADAVAAVEACVRRMATGAVHIAPRRRLEVEDGRLADMAASDLELGYAGVKAYVGMADGAAFVVALFSTERPELVAVLEA